MARASFVAAPQPGHASQRHLLYRRQSGVLVTPDGKSWSLPGGHPEGNETVEDAFRREVDEEACATVINLVYLGAQEVNNPENQAGLKTYYQTRFWRGSTR